MRCEIFADDLDSIVDFYVTVMGFDLARDERATDAPYVALRRDQVHVGAAYRSDAGPAAHRRPPTGVELVLEVDDVEAFFDHVVRCGWAIDGDPVVTSRPWGLRDFRVLDPGGYYWRITDR